MAEQATEGPHFNDMHAQGGSWAWMAVVLRTCEPLCHRLSKGHPMWYKAVGRHALEWGDPLPVHNTIQIPHSPAEPSTTPANQQTRDKALGDKSAKNFWPWHLLVLKCLPSAPWCGQPHGLQLPCCARELPSKKTVFTPIMADVPLTRRPIWDLWLGATIASPDPHASFHKAHMGGWASWRERGTRGVGANEVHGWGGGGWRIGGGGWHEQGAQGEFGAGGSGTQAWRSVVCRGGGGGGGFGTRGFGTDEAHGGRGDGMGWECVQHLPDTSPGRPYVSAACATGCRALDSEPHKPPVTQSETGG